MPFIRVFRSKEDKEVLINTDLIWKVEVTYTSPKDKSGRHWEVDLKSGIENPESVRLYTLFVGSEQVRLHANPGSEVMKYIEQLYNSSIKD